MMIKINGGNITPHLKKDTIKMDVPLFIRSLEWAREDAKSDMALHRMTEHATQEKTLTMRDYPHLIRGAGVGDKFVEAIERRQDVIQKDYKSKKKEGHWSWFLFPLLVEEGQTPSAGTAQYYLQDENEIEDYLTDPAVQRHYSEALNFLSDLVRKGKQQRRPMDYDQSLKAWLGGQDYLKVIKHISQFAPVARRLKMTDILSLYRKIIPNKKIRPTSHPILEEDAYEKEFSK